MIDKIEFKFMKYHIFIPVRLKSERLPKKALKKINIHTIAKANGNQISMEIDLSKLQNVLVNVGNHNYSSQLIIHV